MGPIKQSMIVCLLEIFRYIPCGNSQTLSQRHFSNYEQSAYQALRLLSNQCINYKIELPQGNIVLRYCCVQQKICRVSLLTVRLGFTLQQLHFTATGLLLFDSKWRNSIILLILAVLMFTKRCPREYRQKMAHSPTL